jgi:hypothetical protein
MRIVLSLILIASLLGAESLDESLSGFDDEPTVKKQTNLPPNLPHSYAKRGNKELQKPINDDMIGGFDMEGFDNEPIHSAKEENGKHIGILGDITGKVTEQIAYSYSCDTPHDNISSVKTSLLLDYEHKFNNGFKIKTNAKAYYDAIYDIRGKEKYSNDELDELKEEVELYDAYIEGSLADNIDIKLGRQVVVWGRSDTIRVTDVLNPLDNRRPGMVDIEDLRLPVTMAKIDYFIDDWRITPMAILEQRFSKNPPSGGAFNPRQQSLPDDKDYSDVTPALSIGAEFSGWDINFYASQLHDDTGNFENGKIAHDKVNMFGSAINILKGSWLLKSELAHFDGLKYGSIPNQEFKRTDALLGLEYNGIADTLISYDVAMRKIHNYDQKLVQEPIPKEERAYQHAFRVSSDFANATIKANYLISLFGSNADQGGFQRAWVKYDIADGIYANVGVVDYIGGSKRFDAVSNNDMVFTDITYSF